MPEQPIRDVEADKPKADAGEDDACPGGELDVLAGTWSTSDLAAFDRAVAPFCAIELALWRSSRLRR